MKCYGTLAGELPTGVKVVVEGALLRIYFDFEKCEPVRMEGMDEPVSEQYVCENVDVEGSHDYGNIVSAIILSRYDASRRDAIFANLEMARDGASELDEGKRDEYLKEYTEYQEYRIKAKRIAKEVLDKLG